MIKTISFLLFFPLGLLAQNNAIDSKLRIGVTISPELNKIHLSRISYPFYNDTKTELGFGFSASGNLSYHFNDHWAIRTGFGFGQKKYSYTQEGLTFGSDIDPQLGYIYQSSSLNYQLSLNEFEVPLIVQFSPRGGKFFLSLGAEVDFQNEKNSKVNIHFGNGTNSTSNITIDPTVNFSSVIGAGYILPISDKLEFIVEPVFKFYFKSYIPQNSNLYTLGLKLSLNFGL